MSAALAPLRVSARQWVVVNAHPHREPQARENLLRQGFDAYCPVVRRRRSHARKIEQVLRPLFPGYLFVGVDGSKGRWRPILSTYGVRSLVRFGDEPSYIDTGFIEALKAREIDGAVIRPAVPFRVGQQVEITSGAFDGLVATILKLGERNRLTVLLDLMNRPIKTQVGCIQVMPV